MTGRHTRSRRPSSADAVYPGQASGRVVGTDTVPESGANRDEVVVRFRRAGEMRSEGAAPAHRPHGAAEVKSIRAPADERGSRASGASVALGTVGAAKAAVVESRWRRGLQVAGRVLAAVASRWRMRRAMAALAASESSALRDLAIPPSQIESAVRRGRR